MFQELESYLFSKKGLLHAIVFLAWICLFFILFLFGDTFHRWWLLPVFIVASFFAFLPNLYAIFDWEKVTSKPVIFLFLTWSAGLIWWGMSAFFSQNIPLSLDAMKVQITLYVVFWIVFFRGKILRTKEASQILTGVFVVIGIVLCVVSIVFSFSPVWASRLPGFNILYASYGHNHLASYLLLILPITWWWVYKFRSTVFLVVPLFFTFSLLFSFGRVAVTIGLFQLLILVFMLFRNRTEFSKTHVPQFTQSQKKIVKFVLLLLFSLFLSILFFKFIFSVVYAAFPNSACPIPQYRAQLCKPINTESRPEYWMQALRAFTEYPLTGYGIGTFSLISNRYATQPWNITGYAHNAYLQFFAETGIFGGVFFLIFSLLLIIAAVHS